MAATPLAIPLIAASARALKDRVDEVNKLNVFPVPDGDTGTNMSLTMDAVIVALGELPADADPVTVCRAITHGSLVGARGNSGVILSQILRGLCEVVAEATELRTSVVSSALQRSVEVAFQAVRKPVEGTMLTVLRDSAHAARDATRASVPLDALLDAVVHEAFESVRRTPDLLPVLKENNVVDAGGYGLAILAEGLLAAYRGQDVVVPDIAMARPPEIAIAPADDWDDDEYLYCTEFLLFGSDIDRAAVTEFVASAGSSELVVGDAGEYRVHVHTDNPGSVLSYMTTLGEVADVQVNNMRRQTAERSAALAADAAGSSPRKPLGVVTVATGDGMRAILKSLGADLIVSGGQTMNPSTGELLEAAGRVNADTVVILPNNKNIIMAARQAADNADLPVGVVPTRSIPQAFAALLALDPTASLEDNVASMTESIGGVRTGEVTVAIKDSKAKGGPIRAGDIIGIADGEIEIVGTDILEVAERLVEHVLGDAETVTLLAGEDLADEDLERLASRLAAAHSGIDVETHRGDQPLYPLILSVE